MLVSRAVHVSGVLLVPTRCVSPLRCMPPEGMCESEEGVITGREPDDDVITDASRHGSKDASCPSHHRIRLITDPSHRRLEPSRARSEELDRLPDHSMVTALSFRDAGSSRPRAFRVVVLTVSS